MSLKSKRTGAIFILLISTIEIVVMSACVSAERPKTVAMHLIRQDWGSVGISHSDLYSFVYEVREGQRFGPKENVTRSMTYRTTDQVFVLLRILSQDSVEVGYDSCLTFAVNSIRGIFEPDTAYTLFLSHEYVGGSTRSVDGGTTYYLRVDSVYEPFPYNIAALGSVERETTSSERPDTSFLYPKESFDTVTGIKTVWTERLHEYQSEFAPKGIVTQEFAKHGVLRSFYSGGRRREETEYVLGREHGSHRRWYDNGQIEVEGRFSHGIRNGAFKFWNRNGSLAGETQFDSGNAIIALKYENGQERMAGQYRAGSPCGLWREWYPNGQIAREEVVGEGGNLVSQVPPHETNWMEFPTRLPTSSGIPAASAAGSKAWYENGQIKAEAGYDTAVLDTPLDLQMLLLPFDSLAVTELSDPGSVTLGKLHYPAIEPRRSRCRIEREWHPNGQVSREVFIYDDGSTRELTRHQGGSYKGIYDNRPGLGQRISIDWAVERQISSWTISNDDWEGDYSTYFVSYLDGLRHFTEISDSKYLNRVFTKFDSKGRPTWIRTCRDGRVVSDVTMNPDSLSRRPK